MSVCALNTGNEADMQRSMDLLSTPCDNFGLTISTKKTEVMYQPMPGKPYQELNVKVNNQKLILIAVDVHLLYLAVCTSTEKPMPESVYLN